MYGPAVDQLFADESAVDGLLWALADRQGSIRDWADYDVGTDTTSVYDHVILDSFGNIKSQSNLSHKITIAFTARYRDPATGLQWNRARWYDPATGRWLSEDPIGFGGGDVNLRRYVGNSPTNGVDPSGLAGKRRWVDAPDGFRFGIDSGPELSRTGGFEVHVYNHRGQEIAKLNGRGGWARAHGGKPLPCTPSQFKQAHREAYNSLKRTMRAERRAARRAGWTRGVQNLSCFLLAFEVSTIAAVEEASGNPNFKRLVNNLEHGRGQAAEQCAQQFYSDLWVHQGTKAALLWRRAWHHAVDEATRENRGECNTFEDLEDR